MMPSFESRFIAYFEAGRCSPSKVRWRVEVCMVYGALLTWNKKARFYIFVLKAVELVYFLCHFFPPLFYSDQMDELCG